MGGSFATMKIDQLFKWKNLSLLLLNLKKTATMLDDDRN